MGFFSELVELHNAVTFGEKEEKEFDKFVLENKEKFNNPEYLQIFAERMSPLPRYYDEHLEMCQFFYNFMENNPDWGNFNFNLRTFIRVIAVILTVFLKNSFKRIEFLTILKWMKMWMDPQYLKYIGQMKIYISKFLIWRRTRKR